MSVAGLMLLAALCSTLYASCGSPGFAWTRATATTARAAQLPRSLPARRARSSVSQPAEAKRASRPNRGERTRRSKRQTGREAQPRGKGARRSNAYMLGTFFAGVVGAAAALLPRSLVARSADEDSSKPSARGLSKAFIPEGSKRAKLAESIGKAVDTAVTRLDRFLKDAGSQDFLEGLLDAMGKAESKLEQDLEVNGERNLLDKMFSNIKPPIGLIAHDTCASRSEDGWEVPVQAWVFRRNEGRHKIRLTMCQKLLAEGRHKIFDVDEAAQQLYEERARLVFRSLVFRGGEEKRKLEVRFGDPDGETSDWLPLPAETDKEGRVSTAVRLSAEAAARVVKPNGMMPMQLRLVLPDRETSYGEATVCLVEQEGLTVISDIDDTVKITEVFKGKNKVVYNTFFEEFKVVPGMADLYQSWAKTRPGMSLHFVSNSPPELIEPLRNFIKEENFPQAPLHLRPIRGKDRADFKQRTIESLMEQFPGRRIVLVGDSGEADGLIYATMWKKYPGRVAKILIREVDDTAPANLSFFEGLPDNAWQVFREASEIDVPASVLRGLEVGEAEKVPSSAQEVPAE